MVEAAEPSAEQYQWFEVETLVLVAALPSADSQLRPKAPNCGQRQAAKPTSRAIRGEHSQRITLRIATLAISLRNVQHGAIRDDNSRVSAAPLNPGLAATRIEGERGPICSTSWREVVLASPVNHSHA